MSKAVGTFGRPSILGAAGSNPFLPKSATTVAKLPAPVIAAAPAKTPAAAPYRKPQSFQRLQCNSLQSFQQPLQQRSSWLTRHLQP